MNHVKKFALILLTLIPILAGCLINFVILVPIIGTLFFYIFPLLVLTFWFWLGGQYAKTDWKALPAILIGSASGILSLALYLWQFVGQNAESRNLFLAGLSQMYSLSTPVYLVARVAVLFETRPDDMGQTTAIAMQILSLILMIAVFSAGFFWSRKHCTKKNEV